MVFYLFFFFCSSIAHYYHGHSTYNNNNNIMTNERYLMTYWNNDGFFSFLSSKLSTAEWKKKNDWSNAEGPLTRKSLMALINTTTIRLLPASLYTSFWHGSTQKFRSEQQENNIMYIITNIYLRRNNVDK